MGSMTYVISHAENTIENLEKVDTHAYMHTFWRSWSCIMVLNLIRTTFAESGYLRKSSLLHATLASDLGFGGFGRTN